MQIVLQLNKVVSHLKKKKKKKFRTVGLKEKVKKRSDFLVLMQMSFSVCKRKRDLTTGI